MLKLAQLKYPGFPLKVTASQATVSRIILPCPLVTTCMADDQFMTRETCYFATDFESELRDMASPAGLAAATTVVQFPYVAQVS